MDATVNEIRETRRKILACRQELAKLEGRMDELLGLNSGRRAPKRKMPDRCQASALFADIEAQAYERSKEI
jgi:hypothetical protein